VCESVQYRLEHHFRLLKRFVVPESQNRDALRRQILCKRSIYLLIVLRTVQFDYGTLRFTIKIYDIGWHRVLAAKFMAIQTTASQVIPKLLFCFGRRLP
jgi:hypothetical protein